MEVRVKSPDSSNLVNASFSSLGSIGFFREEQGLRESLLPSSLHFLRNSVPKKAVLTLVLSGVQLLQVIVHYGRWVGSLMPVDW